MWLLLFVVTVLIITSECVAYAPPSLVKYQHVGDIGFGIQVSNRNVYFCVIVAYA